MRFISNGDYIFPFEAVYYWVKHVFIWSYQAGATNIDGIIRLPWRLPSILVFELFGNLAVSYFYLALSFLIVFLSFYYFCRHFLKLNDRLTIIVGSLLVTFNPIFLGNTAKIGLVAAAAMLPLCLTLLSQAFAKRRMSYLILYIFALNFSLLHPFTFTVNLVVTGIFFVYLALKHWPFVRKNLVKLLAVIVTAVLLNLYFILPIMNLGTVDKSAVSQELTDSPIDYTWLVDVANTGDIFTGMSLSKDVLKDFEFYTPGYGLIYFTAVFAFYILLIGLYLYVERRMKRRDKQQFVLFASGFFVLTLLATVTFLYVGDLIKLLITTLPGGWMFRSPLKWQLYVPFMLFGALLLLMRYVTRKRILWTINGLLIALFVLANAVLFMEIGQKLLIPRTLERFAVLNQQDFDQKTLVFIGAEGCAEFSRENPVVMTELNQVLISRNVQIKRVDETQLRTLNINDYNYVLGCQLDQAKAQDQLSAFSETASFVDGTFRLFKNNYPEPSAFATSTVYSLGEDPDVQQMRDFAASALQNKEFDFVSGQALVQGSTELRNVFGNLTPQSIRNGALTSEISAGESGARELVVRDTGQALYYRVDGDRIVVSPHAFAESSPVTFANGFGRLPINIQPNGSMSFEYDDDNYRYQNILPNPSLENGLWQQDVGDCNAYDEVPLLSMKLDQTEKIHGGQSLQLDATRHTACTGPEPTTVNANATYILSFQHLTTDATYGGYFVGFGNDDGEQDIKKRLQKSGKDWQSTTEPIHVPADANELSLLVYAYPKELTGESARVRYDNFQLIHIPDVLDTFYVVDSPKSSDKALPQVASTVVDPTRKVITIKNASTPFYMGLRENYHDKWRLVSEQTDAPIQAQHFHLNNAMNGWRIDPASICRKNPNVCQQNSDGSYNLRLVAEFEPQRWFTIGAIISGVTMVGCVGFLVYDWRKNRRKGDDDEE